MSDCEKAYRPLSKAEEKRVMRLQRIANLKTTWHRFFWKALWKLKLATIYSKLLCRLGLYGKFIDGRCQYCGRVKK